MGPVVKVRRADVDKIAQEFDSAPEDTPENVNRKDAIRILEPKIKTMRRKGYSWQRIGELLTKGGIPIEPGLLASYVRDARGASRTRSKPGKGHTVPQGTSKEGTSTEQGTRANPGIEELAQSGAPAASKLSSLADSIAGVPDRADRDGRRPQGHPRSPAE
jgi:hypothetical protein